MKKTIFLTGSKGFIGSHLYNAIKDSYDVICGGHNELPPFTPDYVVHLAATTTTTDSFIPELFENNIVYAKQIMSIKTRIIYASSTSAAELSNPYAYSKRYIEWLGERHGNATGLRFFNVYGPGNNKGIVKKALECKSIDVYGGNNIRDFIHVDDVVRAIINSLDSKEKIIEVGTGVGISIFDALNVIRKVAKKSINERILPSMDTDMKYSVANPGIPDCLSLEAGLKKMI